MTVALITTTFIFLLHLHLQTVVHGLGSASTAAVVYGSSVAVCGIVAGEPTQRVRCFRNSQTISLLPNISFEEISGGRTFLCGLRRGGLSLLCWDGSFRPKRIYHSEAAALTDLTVGDEQVCAREASTGVARCWRGGGSNGGEWSTNDHDGELSPLRFRKITCGSGFVCGILRNNSNVLCWDTERVYSGTIGAKIQSEFGNLSMLSLVAGESHACGLTNNGTLVCKGNNNYGQLNVPNSISTLASYDSSSFALGANFTCAIRRRNGLVTCWGDRNRFQAYSYFFANVSFESIVAGLDFACGLTTSSLSLICWGPGWSASQGYDLPLGTIAPGPCVESSCGACGTYPDSETLCPGSGKICKSCQVELPFAVPLPPQKGNSTTPSSHSKDKRKLLLAFLIIGLVGTFTGLWSLVYCLWTGIMHRCFKREREHSTTVHEAHSNVAARNESSPSKGVPIEAIDQTIGRQKSVASKPETFSVSELASATNNFARGNEIGSGSFGVVYRGRLSDGREVAVKRGHSRTKKSFQEKESAFESELALLSRLHHKHLVSLLGFCEENDERLLVYDYMPNGSLHHHLHSVNDGVLSSWRARIRIALEAARGIEYLHDYAVPPIIHRDIKSSNILLDSSWTAKVSDFGLSLVGPETGQDRDYVSAKAVGTVGYIDPEYYVLNALTAKSDVYGLGVVMLELLTGKRAVFRAEGGDVTSVVEYAASCMVGEGGEAVARALDGRVGAPMGSDARAVEALASTAMRCARLERSERPAVAEIVADLEAALALCANDGASVA